MKRKYVSSKSKKRYTKSRRTFRPKYRRNRIRRSLPLQGMPNKKPVRLRYVETFTLNPVAGAKSQYVFRANDCRDPNETSTGHQPKGFDQMMAFYHHCTVVGSKITIRAYNNTTAIQIPGMMFCKLSASGTELANASTLEELMEEPRLTGRKMAGGLGYGSDRSGPNMIVITNKFSAKRFFGKRFMIGDALYRHSTSSSPTEIAYFEISYHSLNGNDPDNIVVTVQIDYIAVLTEPKQIPGS